MDWAWLLFQPPRASSPTSNAGKKVLAVKSLVMSGKYLIFSSNGKLQTPGLTPGSNG